MLSYPTLKYGMLCYPILHVSLSMGLATVCPQTGVSTDPPDCHVPYHGILWDAMLLQASVQEDKDRILQLIEERNEALTKPPINHGH